MTRKGEGEVLVRLEGVEKAYRLGRTVRVAALRGLNFEMRSGDILAILGPSGSGKTTLLNIAGLLDRPDSGEVWLAGKPTSRLSESLRARLRRTMVAFVFQNFNLLPHLTAVENVALPLRYADSAQIPHSPSELLGSVGLGNRLHHRPDELSGGEQQRVAIARALMLNAPLILADEPTGELDSETAAQVIELLFRQREEGKTVVVVTHNEELANMASRVVRVRDGVVVAER